MIQLTNHLIRSYLRRLGHEAADGKLHILGLRGADRMGPTSIQRNTNPPNRYNDTIALFGTHLEAFRGSVDPGRTWTLKPSNPQGCAHLENGRWLYQFGTHRGRPALVQAAPVVVRRDRDRDGDAEAGEPLDRGWFGINIHAGGAQPTVDAWSAGCQVIAGGWSGDPWKRFYELLQRSGQERFEYFLVDASGLL